jgi:uncharacterized protein YkwD
MKNLILIAILALTMGASAQINYSSEELNLVSLVNKYRASKGLDTLQLSDNLSYTAELHAKDVVEHPKYFKKYESHHFWSGAYGCVVNYEENYNKRTFKARELSGYSDQTTEVYAYSSDDNETAKGYLSSWKASKGHNETILKKNVQSMGVVIYKGHSYIIFGLTVDKNTLIKKI